MSNEKQRILDEAEGNESNEASDDVINQIKLHRYMTVSKTKVKLRMPAPIVNIFSDVIFISVSSSRSRYGWILG